MIEFAMLLTIIVIGWIILLEAIFRLEARIRKLESKDQPEPKPDNTKEEANGK